MGTSGRDHCFGDAVQHRRTQLPLLPVQHDVDDAPRVEVDELVLVRRELQVGQHSPAVAESDGGEEVGGGGHPMLRRARGGALGGALAEIVVLQLVIAVEDDDRRRSEGSRGGPVGLVRHRRRPSPLP